MVSHLTGLAVLFSAGRFYEVGVAGVSVALLRLEDDSAVLDINYEGEATVSIHVQGVM